MNTWPRKRERKFSFGYKIAPESFVEYKVFFFVCINVILEIVSTSSVLTLKEWG